MAYVSLIALFLTVTNFVPISAIGFAPMVLCAWRFYGRTYPAFVTSLSLFAGYALLSTLIYDPASLVNFDFYRRDGNFFVSYAPILAGCVYNHRWNVNKLLTCFFVFAVLANVPPYASYLVHHGLLSPLENAGETFGSYFIARNAAGGFLAMLFCLGLACYLNKSSWSLLAVLALNAAMLVSTYSRGSMLGVLVVLPYVVFGRKRWMLVSLIVGVIAISLAVAAYHTRPSVDYFGFPFDIANPDEKVANLDIRYEWLWPRALAYFSQSPVFGLGFGSFDDHIARVIDYFGLFGQPLEVEIVHSDSHAHNSYLNILAELGVVGLILMMRFMWQLIAWASDGATRAWREGATDYVGYLFVELSAVCLIAMSCSEHRLTSPSNVLIMSLAVSLLLASRAPRVAQSWRRTATSIRA
ncbi:O-antigen ligase family protein [Trinickia sp. EG282A]|uniref:O-antigen ligase family protein n=1 Tax=Trinickia sp. EG282A TaxID=3237013 RepID=UPI0034D39031